MTVIAYKFIPKLNELAVAEADVTGSLMRQVTEVSRGTSRMGLTMFYVDRVPGHASVNIPVMVVMLAATSRVSGLGALSLRYGESSSLDG